MMSMNSISKILRRKELLKLLQQTSKQISAESTLRNGQECFKIQQHSTLTHAHLSKYSTQYSLYTHRFYSVKTAEKSDGESFRNDNQVTVIGDNIPSPFTDIDNSGFPDYIKQFLKKQGFDKPTVIQSQGWPIALNGQNFVGIAQTGTGKTLAYLLPAVIHIKEKTAKKGKGPIALVLAPTRELARQIQVVARDFEKLLNIRCCCVYGGAGRQGQAAELQAGVDLVIATPGRLNDFLMSKTTSLHRCTYVVLDEADRMLDMGFEPQIRQALEGVPLERQILMFSATWPKEVQHLAKEFLGEFVQVNVGSTELTANHNIQQQFHFCDPDEKLDTFKTLMHKIAGEGFGKILVFTNTKVYVDNLTLMLRRNGYPAAGIHGDRTQGQRDMIIRKFRTGATNILVATDVAARGLDVDGVTHVINFDFPSSSEDYIHRIGRTGRSANKGESHTILTPDDGRQAASLIAVLREANQEVPKELDELARSFSINKSLSKQEKFRSKQNSWGNNNRWNKFRKPYNSNRNYGDSYNSNRNYGDSYKNSRNYGNSYNSNRDYEDSDDFGSRHNKYRD